MVYERFKPMKVLVPVKRVADFNVKVRVKADGSGIDLDHVKMAMNPFDEIALEEALRLREKGQVDQVVVVSIGVEKTRDVLRAGLAMGADRAVLVQTSVEAEPEPLNVAKILKGLIEEESPRLVLMGKQAIDDDAAQTGQMLAALLGWGQGTFASKVVLGQDRVEVGREVDGGLQTLSLKLPAVISVDLRLNTPRYASLPNIMKAKRKPIAIKTAQELGVEVANRLAVLETSQPATRGNGIKVGSVSELVDKLKNQAGVIQLQRELS